jgi:hypothetical protein
MHHGPIRKELLPASLSRRDFIGVITALSIAWPPKRAEPPTQPQSSVPEKRTWLNEIWRDGRVEYWTSTGDFVFAFQKTRVMRSLL